VPASGVGRLTLFGLLCLLAMIPLGANGQSNVRLEGIVLDAIDGSPLAGVTVALVGSGHTTVSDQYGRFLFQSTPSGQYLVRARSLGYAEFTSGQITVTTDVTSKMTIRLNRAPHTIPGITVSGQRETEPGGSVTIIEREEIDRPGVNDLGDVLEKVPGVSVERTGGSNGTARVRIRGCDPRQVLVLVDGQSINSSGGPADLNSVALESIQQITISKGGGSAEFGPEALGGVVSLSTHHLSGGGPPSLSLRQNHGSWDSRRSDVTIANPVRSASLSTRFSYSDRQSDGDYDFIYTIDDSSSSGSRLNNHSQATSYHLSGVATFTSDSRIRYSAQHYRSRRGLPGAARQQNESAWRQEDRTAVGLDGEHKVGLGTALSWRLGFTRFNERYQDLYARPMDRFDTRHVNDVITSRVAHHSDPFEGNRFDWGVELRHEQLYHSDYLRVQNSSGRTRRTTWSGFVRERQNLSMPPSMLARTISVDLALRWDRSFTQPENTVPTYPGDPARTSSTLEQLSPKAGVTIGLNGPGNVVLRGSIGRSVRLPAINSLFWQGDARSSGNPDLLPERSRHREAGFDMAFERSWIALAAGMTFFHSDVEDLVVWTQTGVQGVWQPVNLGRAVTTGHEDHLSLDFFGEKIGLIYQNTVTDARNKLDGHAVHDKILTYTPRYVMRYALRASFGPFETSYSIRKVGVRYTNDANTKSYGAYQVQDIAGAVRFDFFRRWQMDLNYAVSNIGDEQYVLIAQHPMTGREHTFGLKISYGLSSLTL
jgi:outer membrane cobalamin receptor